VLSDFRQVRRMSAETPIRPLDHLVLPVVDLTTAGTRLTALGFNVAPDGVHPFGTANCCVYLADGTFLEPLAVADTEVATMASRADNVFTARDAEYRRGFGDDGFSAIVLGSGDAVTDDRLFGDARLSAGPILEFSRPFVDATGKRDTASFALAFAAEPDQSDLFFFTCQRVRVPQVDRSDLQRHANGALAIGEILLCAEQPQAHSQILAEVTGVATRAAGDRSLAVVAGKARITVRTPDSLHHEFGIEVGRRVSLAAVGVVFKVADLVRTGALLRANAIRIADRTDRLVVPPAPGQGATFIFEEAR
jgi:hypothetical protein